ncbi:hypothetical protein BV25DRAFT_1828882 [Artomyces pyxidatus]|uniref:Uncharacterized protein n=1 Tax=Artomyces pyxidatus TaxID=48021 RepID=A0ACB8SV89_9AGAM|nr:hypothetical protein BV25DRAFT_1828882 [Artomyces pyxidatus]
MSQTSTPTQPGSGYASPAHPISPSPPVHAVASTSKTTPPTPPKIKPGNVFSNDGSFIERFQRLKKEEDEKKKQEETAARKRSFDSRFKNRGKRASPDDKNTSDTADDHPAKKVKGDTPLSQYEKEVKGYSGGRILKEDGMGVRPLVK